MNLLQWAAAALLVSSPALAAPAACPPEPMRVTRSAGGTIEYHGTVLGIPDLCLINRADGAGEFYFGIWRSDWPGAGQAYPVIRAVALASPGAKVTFITRSVPGQQFKDSFTNEGIEPVTVDGHTYQALKMAHERDGIEGNTYHSIITGWRDIETGVALRTEEQQISGKSYGPSTTWHAVKVEKLR